MAGNYPAGVTDNDPHFGEYEDGHRTVEGELEYWRRKAREYREKHANDPVHDPGCKCEECECPF